MSVSVVGGEVEALKPGILPGQAEIYVGSGTTQSTYVFPSATIAAWNEFVGTAVPAAAFSGPGGMPTEVVGAGGAGQGGGSGGGGSGSGMAAAPSASQTQGQGQGGSANEAMRTAFPWMLVWLCMVMTMFYLMVH